MMSARIKNLFALLVFLGIFITVITFAEAQSRGKGYVGRGHSAAAASITCNTTLISDGWYCDNDDKSHWFCSSDTTIYDMPLSANFEGNANTLMSQVGYYCVKSTIDQHQLTRIVEKDGDQFLYCEDGDWAIKPDKSILGNGSNCAGATVWHECCPVDKPYFVRNEWSLDAVCMSSADTYDTCVTHNGAVGEWPRDCTSKTDTNCQIDEWNPVWVDQDRDGKINFSDPDADNFYEPDVPTYLCNNNKCVVDPTLLIKDNFYDEYLTYDDISTPVWLTCIPGIDLDPNSPTYNKDPDPVNPASCGGGLHNASDQCVCFNGVGFSKYYYTIAGPTGAQIIFNACHGGPVEQKNACLACMTKNWEGTDNVSYYTWSSSLGCVDTRTNPIVTRLIQIGLGIGSGIAVIRIIQGAFMRQTNDPAKIQEGNEIIVSTIMALVVLAAAVLIMQIIGVNILGIFSMQDFNSIITAN